MLTKAWRIHKLFNNKELKKVIYIFSTDKNIKYDIG